MQNMDSKYCTFGRYFVVYKITSAAEMYIAVFQLSAINKSKVVVLLNKGEDNMVIITVYSTYV